MSLLSILYGKTRVVINDQSGSDATGIKSIAARLKRNVLQQIGAYAGIVLDCTISEEHSYQADVTENPIEDGAPVADHVNLRPFTLKIDGLVTDSPLGLPIVGSVLNVARQFSQIFGSQSRSKDAFDALVTLYKNRTPFTVITNLKRYDNMVISDATFPFTNETGQALDLKLTLTQVSIVKSKIVQASPQTVFKGKVAGTADLGSKITDPVAAGSTVVSDAANIDGDSVLSSIFN